MAKKSYVERTIDELIKRGHDRRHIAIVEKFIRTGCGPNSGGFKRDLFGFLDIVLLDKINVQTVGVQVCGQDWSPHVHKLRGERAARCLDWLDVGNTIQLWGWRKIGGKYTPRFEQVNEAWVLNGRSRDEVFAPPVVECEPVKGAIVAPPLSEQTLVEW